MHKLALSNYWKFQIMGWSLSSLYWAYNAYYQQDYSAISTITNFILDIIVGISLTHAYKLTLDKSSLNSLNRFTIIKAIISIMVLSILFMLLNNLKWYIYWVYIQGETTNFIKSLIFWDPPLITGLRLMAIWVLAYHLYHYHKDQMVLTAHNAELSVLAKQLQLDHLSNQLNPHFFFNSLNSVKSLISENPVKAKRSIDLLSDLLRSSIYSKGNLVNFKDELELIYDYIELEKLRFEDRLQFNVDIDQEVLNYYIPSLSIQTLIENAIKHGIQKSIKGGLVELLVFKKNDKIEIVIKSPGHLSIEKDLKNSGLGLDNLRQRLKFQYRGASIFSLKENPSGLITATLIIPAEKMEND